MNDYTALIVVAAYLGIWGLLFLASRLTPLSKYLIFLRDYWWMYLPLVSWLFLVFPLILPPIPLGPIALSLAWSRRRMFPFYRRGCEFLRKAEKSYGFPWGWMVNVGVNLYDMATLGLSQLFATAALLREMIERDGTEAERAEADPVQWVWMRLLVGNVFFIAAYLVCPGYAFAPLLLRMEKRYALYGTPPRPLWEEEAEPSWPEVAREEIPSEPAVVETADQLAAPAPAQEWEALAVPGEPEIVQSAEAWGAAIQTGPVAYEDESRKRRRTLIIVAVVVVVAVVCLACMGCGLLGMLAGPRTGS